MKSKIALGTVQLGLSYGVNNKTGKPDQQEAFKILREAQENGITLLDSADAYGDSLQVIGSYIKEARPSRLQVISKFIGDAQSLNTKVNKILYHIQSESLYAYMYHRFSDYKTGNYKQDLINLRDEGKIKRIGVSLYSVEELETAIKDKEITVIQIPFNPFDTSNKKESLLSEARLRGIEIHVRSVFLQGLFYKDPYQLTGNLQGLGSSLLAFRELVNDYQLDIKTACLNFALHQPFIDRVIIGVETSEQLVQNLESILPEFPQDLIRGFKSIKISDESLLNPSNWKP